MLHAARSARDVPGDRQRGAAQVPAPRAAVEAPHLPTEKRVAVFGRQAIVEQLDSLPLEDFQQELECRFVDESYSFYPYDLILPCTSEDLVLADDFTDLPFPEQESNLRRLLDRIPVARLSIDKSDIGMNLAENLARNYPQVVAETFTNDSKERWATDFKILLQRRDVVLPRQREMVSQIHSIKRRVLPSGKVSFDAKRTGRGHAEASAARAEVTG